LKSEKKKRSLSRPFFAKKLKLVALYFDNFLSLVISACLANAVVHNHLSTLRALCHAGHIKLPYA
jgi:hypothetical protein